MHARKTVRDRIATAIATNGVTVTKSRVYPTDSAELPMFLVYARNETSDWGGAVGAPNRQLQVMIEVLVEAKDGEVDDELDRYTEVIENALNPQGSIDDILWSRITETSYTYNHDGNQGVGIAELTVDVLYRTITADASTFA